MPLFLEVLKQKGYLEDIHITIGQIGSRKISPKDDYSLGDWGIFLPNLTIYGFDADAASCDEANYELSLREITHQEIHIPLTLSDIEGKCNIYVTKHPACSSLYPPNEEYLARFAELSQLIGLDHIEELETTTLDTFCREEYIDSIDFLQVDVQGAELNVFKGAKKIIRQGVLAIQTEVEFYPIYKGQPLFSDVDKYLQGEGFFLSYMNTRHIPRINSPIYVEERPGQLLWGDAFYLRDLISNEIATKDAGQILKLACIADILDFSDYVWELLEYLTLHYGQDNPKYNFQQILTDIAQKVSASSNKPAE